MPEYKVIVSRRVSGNMLEHMTFISSVSVEAAERFVTEFEDVINRLEDNPLQYQIDTSFDNPDEYRRAFFARWYKCLFVVKGNRVYVDSVVDCRQDK